jgi:hypothetical protein
MSSLSDVLTVGVVLVLLFGSIALYLYTRVQQAEQKISLLESILLDLKMSSEIKSYTEIPAFDPMHSEHEVAAVATPAETARDDTDNMSYEVNPVYDTEIQEETTSDYVPFKADDEEEVPDAQIVPDILSASESVPLSNSDASSKTQSIANNYEAMTLKELQTIAKSRGITGAGSMKKGSIIEALKTSDRSSGDHTLESGLIGGTFLETSASFSSE